MPQPNGKLKLRDLARLTGHTVGTVSKALHGKPGLSLDTRERILKAAKETGYIGNALAGSLRSGTTKTVAIILGDISNPLFSIFAKQLIAGLKDSGYSAILLNTDENSLEEERAIVTALSRNVDGVFICPTQQGSANMQLLKHNEVPFVLIGRHFDDDSFDGVCFDDREGGRLAAEHLLSLGHREILLLTGPDYISSARERKQGFFDAFRALRLSPDPKLIREVDIATDAAVHAVEHAVGEGARFTAVCAFSDYVAWQVIYALNGLGLSVPGDVSVIGFDNIQSDIRLPVPLSTVGCDKRAFGRRAVELLLGRIENPSAPREQVRLKTSLVARGTTKPLG